MERRLAAILAADVVGYSRLMEQDEAGTLAALKTRRKEVLEPLVAKHQGRIFKVTGDGVLVEFASAVNAVQCAVDLQHGMAAADGGLPEDRRVVLRIGVNLGDIMVEGSDLYGDGVNIAARLEGIAEPGGILVSGTAYDYVKNKVNAGFDELGAQTLKNIAEPVRSYRVAGTPAIVLSAPKVTTDKPSIAVLPFDNMSGDPGQEYFSDGITEDIITELSRFQQLFVIARHSSFQYRDMAADVKRIGRELTVQYVVEGGIRRSEDRVRITAQLIDTATGSHLWAERYDRGLTDLFSLQEEVAKIIASALAVRLEDEDLANAKRKPPDSMRAYDYWLRGKKCLDRWTPEANVEARRLFEKALEVDPDYARAFAGLGFTYEWGAFYSAWDANAELSHERAYQYAQRAVALDDTDHLPHVTLGWVHHGRGELEQSRQHFERAIAISPNDADTLMNAAVARAWAGEPGVALDMADSAMRLNPRPPDWYRCYLGGCYFAAQRYAEAVTQMERVPDALPELRAFLAIAYVRLGRLNDAKRHMDVFIRQYPLHWAGRPSARSLAAVFTSMREEDIDALRKAGLPE
jgi:TolB-like protein/Tfp pilus assembly protein PilF